MPTFINAIRERNLYTLLLSLIAITLPISRKWNVILIFTLIGVWLLQGNFYEKYKSLKDNKLLAWLLLSIYGLHVISLLYSDNITSAVRDLGQKAFLLALPVVVGSISISTKEKSFILACFVCSCFATLLFLQVNAFVELYWEGNEAAFGHPEFSKNSPTHLSYLSMYSIFCFCVLYLQIEKEWSSLTFIKKAVYLFLLTFFFCSVIILTARMAIVTILITASILVGKSFISKFGWKGIVAILAIPLMGLIIFSSFSRVQQRIMSFSVQDITGRINVWRCAWQVGVEDKWIGVGIGDARDRLVACYGDHEMASEMEAKYNCHNQFLEIFVSLGLLGLAVFALSLLVGLYVAFINGNWLCICFIILISLCMLTESIFERQTGVVFFGLFYSLLVFDSNAKLWARSVKNISGI